MVQKKKIICHNKIVIITCALLCFSETVISSRSRALVKVFNQDNAVLKIDHYVGFRKIGLLTH